MLEIALEADDDWDSRSGWESLATAAIEAAVAKSAFPQLATSDRTVEVSVTLTSNERVRELNAEWRGKDKPTNVLSFPMAETSELQQANVAVQEMLLGDIVIAHGICAAEAREKGVTLEQHASHLLVHGTLHLLGYDHHEEAQAEDMEAREVRALEQLGIGNPYEAAKG